MDACEARHQRRAVEGFELLQAAAVDEARDNLADIVLLARIAWNDPVDFGGIVRWILRRLPIERRPLCPPEVLEDRARDLNGMFVVGREMIGDAGDARVHVA